MSESEWRNAMEETAEMERLRARIAALEAALQDKCHDLPETDYKAFCDGCDNYQREKFGKCRTAELEAEVERLRSRSLSCCFCGVACESLAALKSHSGECREHPLWADAERLERRVVERMCRTAVNCGANSSCAVANWYREDLDKRDAARQQGQEQPHE